MPIQTEPAWWYDVLLNVSQGFLPTLLLAIVAWWQHKALEKANQSLEEFRSTLESRGVFFDRYMTACEELWSLLAKSMRAQADYTRAVNRSPQNSQDIIDLGKGLASARANLKNHVYDHGLFFDDDTRKLVLALDERLADKNVHDVSAETKALQERIRASVKQYLPQALRQ